MADTENNKNSNSPAERAQGNAPALRFPGFTDPWKVKNLEQICSINPKSGKVPEQFVYIDLESIEKGTLKKKSIISRENAPSRAQRVVKYGDVLYQCVRPYQNNHFIFSSNDELEKYVASTGFAQLRNADNPYFLFYSIQTPRFTNDVMNRCTGSNYPAINSTDLSSIQIGVPTLREQEKISSMLCLLDERIATQKRLIEDLEKLKSSINETLYAKLTTDYQTSFSEIGCDYGGLTGKSAEDFGKGKPFITYLNVYQNQVITDCNFDYVEIRKDESQNKVRKGDLLFTLSSETPEEIGYSAVYMGDTKELYLNSFCFGIHISESEKVYPPYIGYFSSTSYFRRKIIPFAQGSTRFNLHKPSLMNMRFSLPTKENQITIFNTLQLLTDKILTETETLTRFIQQRSYMLSKMFI